MSTIVIMPGGFHPFHAGHFALYNSAREAFPGAQVYVAATNDTSARPFPFAIKEKLAKLAGVQPGHFVQVKSPFRAEEITSQFNPEKDRLIFVRSEKDANKPPQAGGVKKDGSPAYLQPLAGETNIRPFAEHAYMAYLPTVEFGPGMTSATEIRTAWPTLNEKRKTALVMSLYPQTQQNPALAANVVKMLDTAIGTELTESGMLGHVMFKSKPPKLKKIQPAVSKTKDFMKRDFSLSEDEVDEGLLGFIAKPAPAKKIEKPDEFSARLMTNRQQKKTPTPPGRIFPGFEDYRKAKERGEINEFASDDFDGRPKFIPWNDFIEGVKGIVGKDFEVVENVVKSTIKARFVPIDPMEFGPTMLYSYYEARAGRGKGAVSTRGSIQVGRYYPNSTALGTRNFITGFNLLKGHPFERHFDLTPENISKIASIIMGNTEGAYQSNPVEENQGWAATFTNEETGQMAGTPATTGMTAGYQQRENQPVAEKKGTKFRDPELLRTKQFAKMHYPTYDPDTAFEKWVQRSLKHSEAEDTQQDKILARLASKVDMLNKKINSFQTADYVEESRRKK